MATTLDNKLVVAISSRALFDLEEENRLFDAGDARAYMQLQLSRLEVPARPGVAFSLVRPDSPRMTLCAHGCFAMRFQSGMRALSRMPVPRTKPRARPSCRNTWPAAPVAPSGPRTSTAT